MKVIPVILCGGSGTRLWPLSRKFFPKQLLALTGGRTLLQQTASRLITHPKVGKPLAICNEEHRFLVAEQLREANIENSGIILEPEGRNTAPAAALAAYHLLETEPDSIMLILPADHMIKNSEEFSTAVEAGVEQAEKGMLVTFGIMPGYPETGYGYIKKSKREPDSSAFAIDTFVEKPSLYKAVEYVESGEFLWNSGMFMFRPEIFLQELENNNSQMAKICSASYHGCGKDLDFLRIDQEAFKQCPSDSIDYAVMEKTDSGVVIPMDPGWSDIGSWQSLWDSGSQNEQGNVIRGDVIAYDTKNSYIHSSGRLVTTVGVEDHVVVETADALLVAPMDRSQDIKEIVSELRNRKRPEADLHKLVFRPWGSYESVIEGDRFQVKIIKVKSGASLSLQKHYHRAEHWIVVKGTALVTRGDKEFILSENESTYIPLGTRHRLKNPGVIPLEIIEVQSGSYLGEDDIVRFDDNYGRAGQDQKKGEVV